MMRLKVPGTDTLAEGYFMTTNKSSNNEKAKEHFRHQIEEARSYDNTAVYEKLANGTWTNDMSQAS